jgi:hypothetical protein
MGGSVTHCYLDSNHRPQIGLSFNKYYAHQNDLVENVTGIELISALYKDGILHCVWSRDLNTQVNGENFDLVNNHYYIQLAKGGMNASMKSSQIKSLQFFSQKYLILCYAFQSLFFKNH